MATTTGATLRPVVLRRATDADREFFYQLRTDPTSVAVSPPGPLLSREEHAAWWAREWRREHRWVAEAGAVPVGTVRLSFAEGDVSLVVVRQERGRGIGEQILHLLAPCAKALGYERIVARVAWGNVPSQHVFAKAGYRPVRLECRL